MLWMHRWVGFKLSGKLNLATMNLYQQVTETHDFLQRKGIGSVEISIILGTGLGESFLSNIDIKISIPYADIPHFPTSIMEYQEGILHYGQYEGKNLLVFQGRFHYYEGYSMQQITFPVRVAGILKTQYLLLSNAAGCLELSWQKGNLMLVDDHINLQPENPLTGLNEEELGNKFVDMSRPYDVSLSEKIRSIACDMDIELREGVYAAVSGPNLETRAEYRYLKLIGADAVGMSTVPEVIVANQINLPCAVISVLTDICDPVNLKPIDIPDILETAKNAEKHLSRIYLKLISYL